MFTSKKEDTAFFLKEEILNLFSGIGRHE